MSLPSWGLADDLPGVDFAGEADPNRGIAKGDNTMTVRAVERPEWKRLFDSFSRAHRGWLVDLELLAPDLGPQVVAQELPLSGISLADPEGDVEVSLSTQDGELLMHHVERPTRVFLMQSAAGADEALDIERHGQVTRLRICSPMLPSEVDGVLP
jgi:hypothetical protein